MHEKKDTCFALRLNYDHRVNLELQTLNGIGVVPYAKWSSVYRLFFRQKLDELLFVYFLIISEFGHRLQLDAIK